MMIKKIVLKKDLKGRRKEVPSLKGEMSDLVTFVTKPVQNTVSAADDEMVGDDGELVILGYEGRLRGLIKEVVEEILRQHGLW